MTISYILMIKSFYNIIINFKYIVKLSKNYNYVHITCLVHHVDIWCKQPFHLWWHKLIAYNVGFIPCWIIVCHMFTIDHTL